MLDLHFFTADSKAWVDVDDVKEALGIKEDEDISLAIKRLKEERERYKSNCDYFAGVAEDKLCDRNKFELELREALGTVDEYADIPGLVRKLKKERDELKDKVRRLRIEANSIYGASCGYSEYTGDKAPAFLCDVISYSWNFGALDTPFPNNSIRVELNLTPTASYKGTIDMEDLKRYIQKYGREKKLGIIESVDYQNAKAARAELAHLYTTVLGKEKLDRDLSPHEVMKAILDAVRQLRDAQFASDQCLRSVYMHVYEGTGYDVSDIYAAPDKLADWIITRYNSARMSSRLVALSEIDDCIDELCDEYTIVQPDRIKTTKERLDYIFAARDDYVDRFDELEDFRSNVCTALCLGGETDDEDILKRVRMTKECHDALCKDYTELRKAIWEAMDRKPETMPGDDERLVGEVAELKRGEKLLIGFRDDVAKAIGMDYPTTNQVILNNVQYIYKDRKGAYELVSKLNDHVTELVKAKEDLQQKFQFQSGLRQQWHDRYESEHERANGVQRCLDKTREALRVKDISLETAKKQYEKVCSNLETAECALNGMKSKVHELQDEKTKVISALGQDIWNDCLK